MFRRIPDHDPLGPEQKAELHAFAAPRLPPQALATLTNAARKALRTGYETDTSPHLEHARAVLGQRNVETIRAAMHAPGRYFSSIDSRNPGQQLAARKYLSAATNVWGRNDRKAVDRGYSIKVLSSKNVLEAKYRLLMHTSPVQCMPRGRPIHPLDVLFAHTYFDNPRARDDAPLSSAALADLRTAQLHGTMRPQVAASIMLQMRQAYDNPYTRPIMVALATLFAREKGHIMFSDDEHAAGALAAPYMDSDNASDSDCASSDAPNSETVAYYNGQHTLLLPAAVDTVTGLPRAGAMEDFIHEAQHMLFHHIVQAQNSPVPAGSPEAYQLDACLAADRALRAKLDICSLPRGARRAYHTIASHLEDCDHYFPHGFNRDDPDDVLTMRVEAIVRPMEQIAGGVPASQVQAVMPHLWDFYMRYATPLLHRYIDTSAKFISREQAIMLQAAPEPMPRLPDLALEQGPWWDEPGAL